MTQSFVDGLNLDFLQRDELHGLDSLLLQVLDALLRSLRVFDDDSVGFAAEDGDHGELVLLLRNFDELGQTAVDAREQSFHGGDGL